MKAAVRAVLALALCSALSAEAAAQIGRVAGTVTDEEGKAIRGATVTAENRDQAPSTFTSTSDSKGRFSILGMRRGSWLFVIQAPGFEPSSARIDVVTTRPNPPLSVRLSKGAAAGTPGPLAGIDAREIQTGIAAAASLAAAGDHAGAIAAYRKLLARVPALTSVLLEIGALHERAGDPRAALDAYRQLSAIEPGNAAARTAIERLSGR